MSWPTDIALGVRLAVGGGRTVRSSLLRLSLTTIGIGLATAMLLLLATAATALSHQAARDAARKPQYSTAATAPLYENEQTSVYGGELVQVDYLEPVAPDAPVPPGVQAIPASGAMVVSPAFAARLAADPGLRARFDQRVVGTIAPEGLTGPDELWAYAGTTGLRNSHSGTGVTRFGTPMSVDQLPGMVVFLGVLAVLVLLVPLLVFVASASRIAGAERERRLSALRLAGASARQVRRIGAAESLVGAVTGGLLGLVAFLVIRPFAAGVDLAGITVFPGDFVPAWQLVVAVFVLLPLLTVGSAWLGMRRLVVEPLGVVRVAKTARRRGWWRLLIVLLGVVLLLPDKAFGVEGNAGAKLPFLLCGGGLLLIGVPTLMPWLTEVAVSRLRGGSPAWQLAIRRLQLDSGTPSRVVAGITVALAGVIALQTSIASVQADAAKATQQDYSSTASVYLDDTNGADALARVRAQPGIESAYLEYRGLLRNNAGQTYSVLIAPCELFEQSYQLSGCTDGDTFLVGEARPGETFSLTRAYESQPGTTQFTVPATARNATSAGRHSDDVLVTLGAAGNIDLSALSAMVDVHLEPNNPAAAQGLYVAMAPLQWRASVRAQEIAGENPTSAFVNLLSGGAVLTMSLAGVSLLVMTVGQLAERRRPLAALSAGGVSRRVLGRSLLWQNAVPMLIGVLAAVAGGLGIGALITRLTGYSSSFQVNGSFVAVIAGVALALVLVLTAAALPVLKSVTRLEALRAE
ncbi:FtsX-like permease family protein [Amycolatopsis taiwanensis]|uniref:ABC3 transporter permease C-terminal domain-containing protein n=1 Tax=Amycolatopsis taiwanensis TaxID=342230 RepID=A0A9W6QWM9_9PSEU|nr:ABC transporter permease [Amycolatopsis taiwanensis]GLY63793.1 hypothetical protein Atai01_04120 [Amycolatopsis taiwanensis]